MGQATSPTNLRLQVPGAGIDLVGAALLTILKDHTWIAFVVLGIGTTMILWPVAQWAIAKLKNRTVWMDEEDLEPVTGRTFRNEVVDIDGKKFIDCTFENATLRYRGTSVISLVRFKVKGVLQFQADHKAIKAYLEVMATLRDLPNISESAVIRADESGTILSEWKDYRAPKDKDKK